MGVLNNILNEFKSSQLKEKSGSSESVKASHQLYFLKSMHLLLLVKKGW